MRALLCIVAGFLFCLHSPVVANVASDSNYRQLEDRLKGGHIRSLERLRESFLQLPDLADRFFLAGGLARNTLRQQMESKTDTEATLDSASTESKNTLSQINKLLANSYGGLTGHLLGRNYYLLHSQPRQARFHQKTVDALLRLIEDSGSGKNIEEPLVILTPDEAHAYAQAKGLEVLGGFYFTPSSGRLFLVLLCSQAGRHSRIFFGLNETWQAIQASSPENKGSGKEASSIGALILQLARAGDSLAQTTVGLSGLNSGSKGSLPVAENWLLEAHDQNNLQATLSLASLYRDLGKASPNKSARFQFEQATLFYLKAMARGSTQAMTSLASLYLSGNFGIDYRGFAVSLLHKASELSDTRAMRILAEIYDSDFYLKTPAGHSPVRPSLKRAARLLEKAGHLGDERARLAYGELLVNRHKEIEFDRRAWVWLREIADNATQEGNPALNARIAEGMILLGWIKARKLLGRRSFGAAKRWWYSAARKVETPAVVNEVAYILAAIEEPGLRDAKVSLELMDRMMRLNPEASNNYAYLDTWASAYAANNKFEQAVAIQKRAIQTARQSDIARRNGELEVLEAHLKAFQQGSPVYDVRLH